MVSITHIERAFGLADVVRTTSACIYNSHCLICDSMFDGVSKIVGKENFSGIGNKFAHITFSTWESANSNVRL